MSARRLLAAGALWICVTVPATATATPDAVRGEQVYARSQACHALAYDRVGPRHCGVIGRAAGSVAGFAYSTAMKDSRIVWNERSLDRFLASPLKVIPGSSMTYDGVPKADDRVDLIAYLKTADLSPECRALRARH